MYIRRPLALICAAFIIVVFILVEIRGYPCVSLSEVIEDSSYITIEGYVQDKSIKDDKYIVMLDKVRLVSSTDGSKKEIEVRYSKSGRSVSDSAGAICYLDNEDMLSGVELPKIGSYVRIRGKASEFNTPTNIGEFDMRKYYATKGYYFCTFSSKVEAASKEYNKGREKMFLVGRKLGEAYDHIFDGVSRGIVKAMLLGDKGDLSSDIKDLFQNGGISHILSISGLHISIIGLGMFKLLRKLRICKTVAAIISVSIMIAYYYMTGRSPSTYRAVCMFGIMLGGLVARRTYDILTALAIAAASIVLGNPYLLMYAGFWLSFLAVLGIAVFSKSVVISDEHFMVPFWIGRRSKLRILKCINGILTGMSVSFFTLPVVLYYYYEFPLYSILINILVIPLMTVLLGFAVCAGILGALKLWTLAAIAGFPCRIILLLYQKICEIAGNLPGNHIPFGKPSLLTVTFFYLLVFIIIILFKIEKYVRKRVHKPIKNKGVYGLLQQLIKHRHKINVAIMIMALLLLFPSKNKLNIVMMDVGQGDGILMYMGNRAYMYDGGSSSESLVAKYKIEPCIKALGINTIDYWFVSHPDMDHISGLIEILEDSNMYGFTINNIVIPDSMTIENDASTLLDLARRQNVNVYKLSEGDKLQYREMSVVCLGPDKNKNYGDDINAYSEILYVNYKDMDALFTGDATVDSEKDYVKYAREHDIGIDNIDILKVSHHGSNTSSSVAALETLNPTIALVSCGLNNRYGHPHSEIIERLEKVGSNIYRTDYQGSIMISTNGKNMTIETFVSN